MHTATLRITERYRGPLLLKEGLRPFFLAANCWAVLSMLLWIGMLTGHVPAPDVFAAIDWHRHELLFGYTSAVIAGFLLTVVANWTGRAPVSGIGLFVLLLLWLAGRVVTYHSFSLPALFVAAIDLLFPVALALVVALELILGKSYRNLFILLIFAVFTGANALFHVENILSLRSGVSARLGLAAVLFLIMIIGGRIIPAFTRNWLLKRDAARLPSAFGVYDIVTLVVSLLVLLAWVATAGMPEYHPYLSAGMLLAGVLHAGRLARWCGEKTVADPLVLILHIAYAFIPVGFLAMAAAVFPAPQVTYSAAVHLWTTGTIAVTCMAVMTRAGLGHTNQPLSVSPLIVAAYTLLLGSVLLRFMASNSTDYFGLVKISAVLWCLAHLAYVLRYAKLFATAR